MLLSHLLAKAQIPGPAGADPDITGIADNSAHVQPGHIFVAIKGYRFDGNEFIPDALARGAAAVVTEREMTLPVPVIAVADARIALAQLCNAWHDFPGQAMTVIGVTASNGKTTTSFMIDSILSRYYGRTGLIGTVIVKDGRNAFSADLTTPGARKLYQWLGAMRDHGCSHVTMEVSSAGLELHRVHGIDFDIAAFNNVTREHIDFHGSFEKYWQQKSKLIRNLSAQAVAVLNGDEEKIRNLAGQTRADVVTYSLKGNPADILIKDVDLSTGAARFNYIVPKNYAGRRHSLTAASLAVRLKVLGLHNVYNAAAAITVAKLCGVPDEHIIDALADFTGVERRFQLIYDRDFKIIDDHFANAGNIDITLETLGLMQYNRLHLVIAIRGSRGSTVNAENAHAVARWASKLPLAGVIITDSVEFTGERDRVSDEERSVFLGILAEAGIKYVYYPKLTDAIEHVLKEAETDDVILLGGCQGMDHAAHVIIPKVARRHAPDEQKEILKILENRVAGSS